MNNYQKMLKNIKMILIIYKNNINRYKMIIKIMNWLMNLFKM